MSRSLRGGLVVLAALALLGCPRSEPDEETATGPVAPPPETEVEPFEADLYFPGDGELLRVERRALEPRETPAEQAEEIVRALIAGPSGPGLHPPLPPTTLLAGLFRESGDRRLILDLRSPDRDPPPPAGSRKELLTVYSFVNSIVLNLEEVDEVVLLWNGRQDRSFSGHVDTGHPLVATPELVDRRAPIASADDARSAEGSTAGAPSPEAETEAETDDDGDGDE